MLDPRIEGLFEPFQINGLRPT
ncbi:MAG: hypothetical protein JWO25_2600, partial [Alphaproteobacteria bacterium]|nr:hypothetical protein [Alphaproteobacteria bacterium]